RCAEKASSTRIACWTARPARPPAWIFSLLACQRCAPREPSVLEHRNGRPTKPTRAVVIGAGGFVGGNIVKTLKRDGVDVLALTRRELDLMAADASDKLKGLLRPSDSVVMVSAKAPAKNYAMLMDNLRMAEAVCRALEAVTVHHVLYISSD